VINRSLTKCLLGCAVTPCSYLHWLLLCSNNSASPHLHWHGVFSTPSCCHCGLRKPCRCALISIQATFSDSADFRNDCELSTTRRTGTFRLQRQVPELPVRMNCLTYLRSNPHHAAGQQIFVTLRPPMAFARIKRQGSILSFHRPAFPFDFWCILWPGYISVLNTLSLN
jgi:hypothetical protein